MPTLNLTLRGHGRCPRRRTRAAGAANSPEAAQSQLLQLALEPLSSPKKGGGGAVGGSGPPVGGGAGGKARRYFFDFLELRTMNYELCLKTLQMQMSQSS